MNDVDRLVVKIGYTMANMYKKLKEDFQFLFVVQARNWFGQILLHSTSVYAWIMSWYSATQSIEYLLCINTYFYWQTKSTFRVEFHNIAQCKKNLYLTIKIRRVKMK